MSGSLEGDSSSQGPNPREERGLVNRDFRGKCGAQPPVSETLGTGMSSMASLPIDIQSTQSCSGVPLSQWGLQNAGNKGVHRLTRLVNYTMASKVTQLIAGLSGLLRGDRRSKGGQGTMTMRLLRCNCRDTVSSRVNVRDGQVLLAYRVTLALISQLVGYIYPRAGCLISGTSGLSDSRVTGQVQF